MPCDFLQAYTDTLQHRKARAAFALYLTLPSFAAQSDSAKRPSSIALFHMRALQALDADLASTSHRRIAAALFGEDTVERDWNTDRYLRAQIGHLIRCAHALMDGGYRDLLYPRQKS